MTKVACSAFFKLACLQLCLVGAYLTRDPAGVPRVAKVAVLKSSVDLQIDGLLQTCLLALRLYLRHCRRGSIQLPGDGRQVEDERKAFLAKH